MNAFTDIPPLDRQTRLYAAAFVALIDQRARDSGEVIPGAAMRSLLRDLTRAGIAGLTNTINVDTGAKTRRLNMAGISASTSADDDHALLMAWRTAARDRLAIR